MDKSHLDKSDVNEKKSQFRCEIVALQFRRGLRKYSSDS